MIPSSGYVFNAFVPPQGCQGRFALVVWRTEIEVLYRHKCKFAPVGCPGFGHDKLILGPQVVVPKSGHPTDCPVFSHFPTSSKSRFPPFRQTKELLCHSFNERDKTILDVFFGGTTILNPYVVSENRTSHKPCRFSQRTADAQYCIFYKLYTFVLSSMLQQTAVLDVVLEAIAYSINP